MRWIVTTSTECIHRIAGSASVVLYVQMEFEKCLWTRLVSEINADESINVTSAPSPPNKMLKWRQFFLRQCVQTPGCSSTVSV